MTVDDEVWRALNSLRASHRDGGCQRAECAIASLYDEDLEEILHATRQHNPARVKELGWTLDRADEHIDGVAATASDRGWPRSRETMLYDASIEPDAAAAEITTMRPFVEAAEATPPVTDAARVEWPQGNPLPFEETGGRADDIVSAAQMAVVGSGESSPDGATSESEEAEPRFEVGSRVVYDPEAQVNLELGGDYAGLGICTVTAWDAAAYGQLLSFVDENGDMHDGWWADRFKAALIEATAEDGEDDVTYFVAFWSATGYGCRVLVPRPKIVTAADVIAMTDHLATEVGGDVVPLNWIELPPPLPKTTRARQVAVNDSGSSTENRSTLAPIRIDRGNDHRVLNVSGPSTGQTPRTHPVRAAAPGERPDLPYLPRRAM